MIRTKGEAGTGNIVEAVRHMRAVTEGIRKLVSTPQEELMSVVKELGAPFTLVEELHKTGKLPVVNFAAGGVATPADAALMVQLGAEGYLLARVSSSPVTRRPGLKPSSRQPPTFKTRRLLLRSPKTLGRLCPG